ncbi:MAG: hypothetical protein ACKO0N_05110 [Planctomycetota bacterium]
MEVEFGDRVTGEPVAKAKVIGPHHNRAAHVAKAARVAKAAHATGTPAFAATVQAAQPSSLRIASAAPQLAASENSASTPLIRPEDKLSFAPQQPLYRFDSAHPPVGGRTAAAMKIQQVKHSAAAVEPKTPAATEPAPPIAAPVVELPRSAAETLPFPQVQTAQATRRLPEKDFALLRELAEFSESKPKQAEPQPAPHSEFALRPVPRSFLFPRRTNRWPGRLCLLAGGLFISGQSLLIYSFLRVEPLGVAAGILASAGAFALTLYMIARYCDEELER